MSSSISDSAGGDDLLTGSFHDFQITNTGTRTSTVTDSASPNASYSHIYWKEPIVVGYAFGPKKMSTMGVVLAEASRVNVIHEEFEEENEFDNDDDDGGGGGGDTIAVGTTEEYGEERPPREKIINHRQQAPSLLTRAALRGLEEETEKATAEIAISRREEITNNKDCNNFENSKSNKKTITYDNNCPTPPQSTIITLGNSSDTGLQHIIRYFRSSCSSAAASTSIASVSETTVSTPTTTNSLPITISGSNSNNRRQQQEQHRHRREGRGQISFVPLDPDQPIEDQHGGHFDLILHKLTEDILTCSLMKDSDETHYQRRQQQQCQSSSVEDPSMRRIHALRDYCNYRNPNCCLVDDPKLIEMLMSRSEIANVLKSCLKQVKTTSGIPVKSPRFVVIPELQEEENPSSTEKTINSQRQQQTKRLKQALQKESSEDGVILSTPLIVKPLIAAGTKESHWMSIALKESALLKLPPKSIVQEFVNHDATLYKVYVLGDFVNVYERHSLPNLPADLSNSKVDLVKFDSQRQYPKLEDFYLDVNTDCCTASDTSNTRNKNDYTTTCSNNNVPITVNEVKPIVDALKQAFGLQLFGFDILVQSDHAECFVVDVNYFPSYKEVTNFPSLLARYLTQRVLEQRKKGRINFGGNTESI